MARRSLTLAATLAAALAAPAAAQAATYTVNPGSDPCGGADVVCGGLAQAASAAVPGDVFNVTPGTYEGAEFDVGGLTITGTPNFAVNGTLTFSGSGAVTKLQKVLVSRLADVGPGILVTKTGGFELSDAAVVSANDDGVRFTEGMGNKIVRSVIITGGQQTGAVRVTSADTSTADKQLTLESTLLRGGRAGLWVKTGEGALLGSSAGDVSVILRHVTAAGSQNGIVLDATGAPGPLLGASAGNITADVADSIIQNNTAKAAFTGLLLTHNTVADTYTRTLQESFDSNAVFVNPASGNYRLRAGSPAINAGGVTAGESPTDIDGNDRSTAPTDQGADEFVAGAVVTPPGTGTVPGSVVNDGVAPAVVITRPRSRQRIKLVTRTTKTNPTTKKKTTTSKRTKIVVRGTAKDASGVRAVVLTIEKTSTTVSKPSTSASSASATTTATKKCKWLNASKGIVLKSCTKPVLLAAKLNAKEGTWTFSVKSTIKLGAGKYRVTVIGLDNSGKAGNSAKRADAIRSFTLVK